MGAENILNEIDVEAELKKYSPNERAEIEAFADRIDVTRKEKIAKYGEEYLVRAFTSCQKFLLICDNFLNSYTYSEVFKVTDEASELCTEARKLLQEFNLKKSSFILKILFKIFLNVFKREKLVVACYSCLNRFKVLSKKWLNVLKEEKPYFTLSDKEACESLKKYVISGYLATKKIEATLTKGQEKYEESKELSDFLDYDNLTKNYDAFFTTLTNLEIARRLYQVGFELERLILKYSHDTRIVIKLQRNNMVAVIKREESDVTEKKKTKLSEELNEALKKLLSDDVLIDEELWLYPEVFGITEAKEALSTVIYSCSQVESIKMKYAPKIHQNADEMNKLFVNLKQYVFNNLE